MCTDGPSHFAASPIRVELQLDFLEAVFGSSRELDVDRLTGCEVSKTCKRRLIGGKSVEDRTVPSSTRYRKVPASSRPATRECVTAT